MAKKKAAKKRVAPVRKRTKRATRAKSVKRAAAAPVTNVVLNLTQARDELLAQRTALDEQITMIDRALAAMGSASPSAGRTRAAGPGRRGRRGRRSGSLKDVIGRVMAARKGPMEVKAITTAVMKSGYKTKNKTLAKSVGIALTQMPEITKVSRGTFRLR